MLHLSRRPLTASELDDRLFVDREQELRRIVRGIELGLHTYVGAPPGAGKTSLLHRVERLLGGRAAYVNGERLDGPWDVQAKVTSVVRSAVPRRQRVDRRAEPVDGPFAALAAVAHDHADPVVLLDAPPPDVRHHLFGRYRDELAVVPVTWVVTGRATRLPPPEDSFFGSLVELAPLSEAEVRNLLLRRLGDGAAGRDAETMRALAEHLPSVLGRTTPAAALAMAAAVLVNDDPERALAHLRGQEAAATDLPPSSRALLDALVPLAPVHAGDERLLAELGITRSRAVQILKELEAKGLVRAVRQGRRLLYEPAWRAA